MNSWLSYPVASRVPRVAIVGEWLASRAGSEQVFDAIARAVPDADLFALTAAPDVDWRVDGRPVRTTVLDRDELRDRRGLTLAAMPAVWRWFRPGDYDVVISSSHAAVKGFWPGREALHLSYVHTPMRYVWFPSVDQRGAAPLLAPARQLLRRWDRRSTRWVDAIAANSTYVAGRIKRVWGRDAVVIPPPVARVRPDRDICPSSDRVGVLSAGRLIPYKRHDLAIAACLRLGVPLTIAGRGPEEARLRELAQSSPLIRFELGPSDDRLDQLYARSEAVFFGGLEDFGIVPVEAASFGTPVCAYGAGGALDTVIPGRTGTLFYDQTVAAASEALSTCLAARWPHCGIASFAGQYSAQSFRQRLGDWITRAAASRELRLELAPHQAVRC